MKRDTGEGVLRLALVGLGRLGRAIARARAAHVVAVFDTAREAAEIGARLCPHAAVLSGIEDVLSSGANAVWIATPDRQIAPTVERLAGSGRWDGIVVVHSSGMLPLSILNPIRERQAITVALHPNHTVGGEEPLPRNLYWGGGAYGGELADLAAWLLGTGEHFVFDLPDQHRPLYHAAASAVANYPVVLLALGFELYGRAGLDPELSARLCQSFMQAALERTARYGPLKALTGPVARGDAEVVERQLEAVRQAIPEAGAAFEELAQLTRWLAARSEP
jgi:predicted short-subunit dehydrogenase-like oxidoreductase (DUF2520 family)